MQHGSKRPQELDCKCYRTAISKRQRERGPFNGGCDNLPTFYFRTGRYSVPSTLQKFIPRSCLSYYPPPSQDWVSPAPGTCNSSTLGPAPGALFPKTHPANQPPIPPPSTLKGQGSSPIPHSLLHAASVLRLGNLNNSTSTAEAAHFVAAGSFDLLLQQRHGPLCPGSSFSSSAPSCCSPLSSLTTPLTASFPRRNVPVAHR